MTAEMAADAHWSFDKDCVFPETAIPANAAKQNYSIFPRKFYVDIERCCTHCGRWFIFYAVEQKFWFEELGFYVDADCTKCIDCRKNDQNLKLLQKRYQVLNVKSDRTTKETSELKKIALELFQLGYIKDKAKVDRIG